MVSSPKETKTTRSHDQRVNGRGRVYTRGNNSVAVDTSSIGLVHGHGELAEPMGVRFCAHTDFTLAHFARCFRPAGQPLRMCRCCWDKFERALEAVTSKATLYKIRIGSRLPKSALHPADNNTVLFHHFCVFFVCYGT